MVTQLISENIKAMTPKQVPPIFTVHWSGVVDDPRARPPPPPPNFQPTTTRHDSAGQCSCCVWNLIGWERSRDLRTTPVPPSTSKPIRGFESPIKTSGAEITKFIKAHSFQIKIATDWLQTGL